MMEEKNEISSKILNYALQIIHLLTGKDYIIVRKYSEHNTDRSSLQEPDGLCKTQSPITISLTNSHTQETNHKRKMMNEKILELINKIADLLTVEDSAEFDEVAVYFSKEDWDSQEEEHNKFYKDVMLESNQILKPLDAGQAHLKHGNSSVKQGKHPCVGQANEKGMTPDISSDLAGPEMVVKMEKERESAFVRHPQHPQEKGIPADIKTDLAGPEMVVKMEKETESAFVRHPQHPQEKGMPADIKTVSQSNPASVESELEVKIEHEELIVGDDQQPGEREIPTDISSAMWHQTPGIVAAESSLQTITEQSDTTVEAHSVSTQFNQQDAIIKVNYQWGTGLWIHSAESHGWMNPTTSSQSKTETLLLPNVSRSKNFLHCKKDTTDETAAERKRRLARERKKRWKEKQTPEALAEIRFREAERKRISRIYESQEAAKFRLQIEAERRRQKQLMESEKEAERRKRLDAERRAEKRLHETTEEREKRLKAEALRHAKRRSHETAERKEQRKRSAALRKARRRMHETPEQREQRLRVEARKQAERRLRETAERREQRLRADAERHARRRINQIKEQTEQRLGYEHEMQSIQHNVFCSSLSEKDILPDFK
ncbi:uncharacterized protein O3C94_012606 isoform 1-T2 [Discoglossus pictus]